MSGPNHLFGGRKHHGKHPHLSHGNPNLEDPQGTHGTIQMPLSDDPQDVWNAINAQFGKMRVPGIDFIGSIEFEAHDNDDGTMEVNFEVKY